MGSRRLAGRKEENTDDGVEVNMTKTLKLREGKYSWHVLSRFSHV